MKSFLFALLAGVLICTLLLAGCTSQPPETPPVTVTTLQTTMVTPLPTSVPVIVNPQETLAGVTWYLVAFNKGAGSENILPGTEITALFDGAGRLSGSAGCNQYTASYQGAVNSIQIGTPATTRMICDTPSGTMTQETYYLTTLQGASTFKIEGDILTVYDSSGKALFTYTKVVPGSEPPAPLTGVTWYLLSYVDSKGEIFAPVSGTTVTVQFDSGGNVTGNAGCNSYFGTYTTSGISGIAIGPLGSTKMNCAGDAVMNQENLYVQLLQKMTLYYTSPDELLLSDGSGSAILTYGMRK
jgi:heat shock protein HslJ